MTWHVTARMAWHDRKWDGRVCKDPAANTYCIGSHSLLSERLAREKRLDRECADAPLDKLLPDYQPPCFWSSCAFAAESVETLHRHPFMKWREDKLIGGDLPPYSVYTWPFRLSITNATYQRNGQYFPDLEQRVDRYVNRLEKGRSLVFFYLNYDNPVSADEYKYALVGCARIADVTTTGAFPFSESELQDMRAKPGMKNFPSLNWALRVTHQGASASVRLPYHEYLDHLETHPEDEAKLEEIRVLIDDPALVPGFKYVSEPVNDDHALMLLYKMRRALLRAQEHSLCDVDASIELVEQFIEDCWADRGLYPGLSSVLNVLADLAEGEPQLEGSRGQEAVLALRSTLEPGQDLLDRLFELLASGTPIPDALAAHRPTFRDARAGWRDHKSLVPVFRKLSLFALTPRQMARIIFPDTDGRAFGQRSIAPADIATNPYVLAESYVPATDRDAERRKDLDRELRTDGPVDYSTIDIGMFPDSRYVERHDELHDLTVAGPQRLRAFTIEALRHAQAGGDSFLSTKRLIEHAADHPLFHKERLAISEGQFLSDEHLAHFRDRQHVENVDGEHFFYLQETYDAERTVARFVEARLKLPAHAVDLAWLPDLLDAEASAIAELIVDFDASGFRQERERLVKGALSRPFYCITGRPGSGKSQAVSELLKRFEQLGQRTLVLAPTGKAALRLNIGAPESATWEAQTIDRWAYRSKLSPYLAEGADLQRMVKSKDFELVDNVIVDEMSMVNLFQLALLFRALEVHQPSSTKRVILVGDENQLPPIGCGKPFNDIIEHLRADSGRESDYHVRLTTNCRQQQDTTVLDAAHLFAGKNRYHDELFDALCAGGQISDLLDVRYFDSTNELQAHVSSFVEDVLASSVPEHATLAKEESFNRLLKLYDNGYVPQNSTVDLSLDRAQLLSPYRVGPTGALGLSELMRSTYRSDTRSHSRKETDGYWHSDKIVRITNYYAKDRETGERVLRLSNGSVGVLCKNNWGWMAYFPEADKPLKWKWMDPEDFEAAYALTVHKAQGSEFQEVLVVVPERRALLSRELLYTAMTRSKTRLTLLVEKSDRANPLQVARQRSVLETRNSSTFTCPYESRRLFQPESGIKVQSKIEYMIYEALKRAREEGKLTFEYEAGLDLPFDGRVVPVKPDFTIHCGEKTFYLEHLGMLDRQDYARDWRRRRRAYRDAGLEEVLVTTDDLAGVRADLLSSMIEDLVAGEPKGRADTSFSVHHYVL